MNGGARETPSIAIPGAAATTNSNGNHSDNPLLSASEDEAEWRAKMGRAQVEASVLYQNPRKHRTRTYSETRGDETVIRQRLNFPPPAQPGQSPAEKPSFIRQRRLSHDEERSQPRRFLIDVEETMRLLLDQEDTDTNYQIAATDKGPKVISLGTVDSNGYNTFEVRGTYMLSNLLQELALAKDYGQKRIVLDEARLSENPVLRLKRMIRNSFWRNLTRRIDADGLEAICADPKNRGRNQAPRIYVPEEEVEMRKYYERVAKERDIGLIVETLPKNWDAKWVRDKNETPGILALAMRRIDRGEGLDPDFEGIPFVVPGARFNELYNWDSYFISLGLLADGYVELAKGIVEHFLFEIKHYGKILNGNRSYYLCRSQPPFLTDLILQVYAQLDPSQEEENKAWLKRAIQGAIQEYHCVWMEQRRLDAKTGLSLYRPDGLGLPPETESSHFTHILQPYADEMEISVNEYIEKYDSGEIEEPRLDEYMQHDRAVRESGHDTTYRFEKRCAHLGTIDLCSLLYKYEVDIATVIREHFDDSLELEQDFALSAFPFGEEVPYKPVIEGLGDLSGARRSTDKAQTSAEWLARAARRKQLADHYLWHEGRGLYTDYNVAKRKQSLYDTVTTFWPMWCGMASEHQAERIMIASLHKFEEPGGLVSGTEASRGKISLDRPNRQWDHPAGWPPHQIMAWVGLTKYGYVHEAQRLAYRWLYMITAGFVEAGGVIPEKFNVVEGSANIDAEYGNQGTDFKYLPREGFGWSNASFVVGLTYITEHMKRALGTLTPPDVFFYHRQQ